jgi:hypothetical protein
MLKLLLLLIFFIPLIYSQNYTTEEDELPEYVTTTTTKTPILALSISQEPETEIRHALEKHGIALCSFPEETLKTSPTLVIYCIIIAILWLFLILTLCFGYIRQIIDRIRAIARNGLLNNRTDSVVDEEGAIGFQGLFPLQQTTVLNQRAPICHHNK